MLWHKGCQVSMTTTKKGWNLQCIFLVVWCKISLCFLPHTNISCGNLRFVVLSPTMLGFQYIYLLIVHLTRKIALPKLTEVLFSAVLECPPVWLLWVVWHKLLQSSLVLINPTHWIMILRTKTKFVLNVFTVVNISTMLLFFKAVFGCELWISYANYSFSAIEKTNLWCF